MEIELEVGVEKRAAEDSGVEGKRKKARSEVVGDVKRVAEMVLVLAALGRMRGGRAPSDAEREMMAVAREKLAEVCGAFAPKDVFPVEVFGGLIEDLGLNKCREQQQETKLGFRPPKISIAEKLKLSKRKMEKSEEFPVPAVSHSSMKVQASSGAAVESRGAQPAVRMFSSDKTNNMSISMGNVQSASPLGHGALSNSTLPYQLPAGDTRPIVSSGFPSGHLGRDASSVALPRVDQPHFRWDGRANGSSHASQFHANSSGNHATMKTPTWSVQPSSISSISSAKGGPDNKVPMHATIKVEGTGNSKSAVSSHVTSSKSFISQNTSVNPSSRHHNSQGINFAQGPSKSNAHAEICKIIQKLLQPRSLDRPPWTPPSRDYMNKALTCQMCKFTINEVENVLVCDACEKGYHLKCLQANNQKGIPRVEWHCARCLSLSNGKALPPKYGRVMRNVGVAKLPSNTTTIQTSLDKKVGASDGKSNTQKVMENCNSVVQKSSSTNTCNNSHRVSAPVLANSGEIQGNYTAIGKGNMGKKSSETYPINLTNSSSNISISPPTSLPQRSLDRKVEELKSQPLAECGITPASSGHTQVHSKLQNDGHVVAGNSVESSWKHSPEIRSVVDINESSDRVTLNSTSSDQSTHSQQGVVHVSSSVDDFHNVEWIGDAYKVVHEKAFYHSCWINGLVYKVLDYVLIRFNGNKLVPAKLQSMWEESKTRRKWVAVNRCYFPDDLPEGVARPCSMEYEVYESNHSSAVLASLIQGPCKVLPLSKFTEEMQRRHSLEKVPTNDGLQPLYLCKWVYDESERLFRDVSY